MEEKKKKALDFTRLKKENFVVIFLIGILFLIIAWPTQKNQEEGTKSGITDMVSGTIGTKEENYSSVTGVPGNDSEKDYRESLESTLEELLASMEGAGKVKVMITLQSSGESIVEKDMVSSRSSSTEVDSAGGSRNTADVSDSEETVYTGGTGKEDTPFVKKIIYPKIEGVVVCAQGGGNATVNKNITEAIQVLFGIDVHKIKVIKMSSR